MFGMGTPSIQGQQHQKQMPNKERPCLHDPVEVAATRQSMKASMPACPRKASAQLIRDILKARSRGGHFTTPLFAACVMDRADMIPFLMEMVPLVRGAGDGKINEPSGRGFLPLHGAAQHGSMEAAKVLISLGADINHCASSDAISPLQTAAMEGNLEMVMLLVEHGALINNMESAHNNTPLYAASLAKPVYNTSPNFMGVARFLLQEGADVDSKIVNPTMTKAHIEVLPTPLSRATIRDDGEMMRLLLANGADVQAAVASLNGRDKRCLRICINNQRDAAKKSVERLANAITEVDGIMANLRADEAANNLIEAEEKEVSDKRCKAELRASKNERDRLKKQQRIQKKQEKADLQAMQEAEDAQEALAALLRTLSMTRPLLEDSVGTSAAQSPPTPNKEPEEEDECVVCFEQPRDTLTIPCGHILMCACCNDRLQKHCSSTQTKPCCPFCRVPIASTILLQ